MSKSKKKGGAGRSAPRGGGGGGRGRGGEKQAGPSSRGGGKQASRSSQGGYGKVLAILGIVALAVVLLFVWGPWSGGSAGASKPHPDILLISFDTLRADRLGCYGYAAAQTPNIDRIAREGALFEAAAAPVPITLPSHSSMLSGLIPPEHGVRLNDGYQLPASVETLAEVLKAQGYQTGAFIAALPLVKENGLSQGFDVYDDELSTLSPQGAPVARQERFAEEVVASARKWLAKTDPARPVFAFVHIFDAHEPYEKPLPGESMGSYDGEIAHIDRSLGVLFEDLKDERWAGMLTVLTADHGESLGDHGEKTHGFFVYEATLHVPLIFHRPGAIQPGRLAEVAAVADVTPTILDLVGQPFACEYAQSLRPVMEKSGRPDRPVYFECLVSSLRCGWAPLRGIRQGSLKYVSAPTPELYDLSSDPMEQNNLYIQRQAEADELDDLLAMVTVNRQSTATVSPELAKGLESLGYVASGGSGSDDDVTGGLDRPDPKERIEAFERFQAAHREYLAGNGQVALGMMRELESDFSQSPYFYVRYGDYARQNGDWQAAKTYYGNAVQFSPQNELARFNHSVALFKLNDFQASLQELEALLRLNPDHLKGLRAAGELCVRLGQRESAFKYLSHFLELSPTGPEAERARQMLAQAQGGGQ
jgi:arylsulfatase A-like enzyme